MHSCTIQRLQALETRWPNLLLQVVFSDAVKPRGCISWPVWPLRGIDKTAWGARLILTADMAYPVSCAGLGHLLMARDCHLHFSVSFGPPTTPHPSSLSPNHLLKTQSAILQQSKILPQKPGAFK